MGVGSRRRVQRPLHVLHVTDERVVFVEELLVVGGHRVVFRLEVFEGRGGLHELDLLIAQSVFNVWDATGLIDSIR